MVNMKFKKKTWQMVNMKTKQQSNFSPSGNKNISVCSWVLVRTNVPKYQIMLKYSVTQSKIRLICTGDNKCTHGRQGPSDSSPFSATAASYSEIMSLELLWY